MTEIQIRTLHTLSEMRQAVDLQRIYWGNEIESLVPAHVLFTIASYGGHVLAAFDGDKMIGVLIGLLGTNVEESHRPAMANLLIASKRMVVLPAYRSSGIGYRLKLAQRDFAIKQAVRLVTWTFDPLRSPNAYLNLHKLGGVCRKFQIDHYGSDDSSGLSVYGVSDRLHLEWWVTHRRVEERLIGVKPDMTLTHYLDANALIVNPSQYKEGERFVTPSSRLKEPQGLFALIEIPLDFGDMISADPKLTQTWQMVIRDAFTIVMRAGYYVTDFVRGHHEGRDRGFYLMSYDTGYDFNRS